MARKDNRLPPTSFTKKPGPKAKPRGGASYPPDMKVARRSPSGPKLRRPK